MQTFEKGWYVVYTRPQHEKKVAEQLTRLGIENFLPMIRTLRLWSDRRKYINAPLFPSYVFVKLEDRLSYFRSLDTSGVLYFVKNGKEIAGIDEPTIFGIRNIISNAPGDITVSAEYFSPGEKLVICEGPFTGLNCEMISYNGKQKVLLRVDLISRNVIADLPVHYVIPLSKTLAGMSQ